MGRSEWADLSWAHNPFCHALTHINFIGATYICAFKPRRSFVTALNIFFLTQGYLICPYLSVCLCYTGLNSGMSSDTSYHFAALPQRRIGQGSFLNRKMLHFQNLQEGHFSLRYTLKTFTASSVIRLV